MGLVVTSGQSVFDGLLLHVGIKHTSRIPISTQDLGLSVNVEKSLVIYTHQSKTCDNQPKSPLKPWVVMRE